MAIQKSPKQIQHPMVIMLGPPNVPLERLNYFSSVFLEPPHFDVRGIHDLQDQLELAKMRKEFRQAGKKRPVIEMPQIPREFSIIVPQTSRSDSPRLVARVIPMKREREGSPLPYKVKVVGRFLPDGSFPKLKVPYLPGIFKEPEEIPDAPHRDKIQVFYETNHGTKEHGFRAMTVNPVTARESRDLEKVLKTKLPEDLFERKVLGR